MSECVIRLANPGDRCAAYHVCLKTGDQGRDGAALYQDDPDALGRIYVGPYLEFEPELSLVVEDEAGVCGYALGAIDSRTFYARYEREWRPLLCARFPEPTGDPSTWTPLQHVYHAYHHPDYLLPRAVRPLSVTPAHRSAGTRARPRLRTPSDRARPAGAPPAWLARRAPGHERAQHAAPTVSTSDWAFAS